MRNTSKPSPVTSAIKAGFEASQEALADVYAKLRGEIRTRKDVPGAVDAAQESGLQVKVLDFGIAKLRPEHMDPDGTLLQTVQHDGGTRSRLRHGPW